MKTTSCNKDKFFCKKFVKGYGDTEYYPSSKSIRSYNRQKLRQGLIDEYRSLKKGFVDFY